MPTTGWLDIISSSAPTKKSIPIYKFVPLLGMEELFNMAGHYVDARGLRYLWSRLGIEIQHVIYFETQQHNESEKFYEKTIEVCSPIDIGFILNCRNIFQHQFHTITQEDMEKLWSSQVLRMITYFNEFCKHASKTNTYFQSNENILYWNDNRVIEINVNVDRALYLIYLFTTNITVSSFDRAIMILLYPGFTVAQLNARLRFLHNTVRYPEHYSETLKSSMKHVKMNQPMNLSTTENHNHQVQQLQQEEFKLMQFIIQEYTSSFYGSNQYDNIKNVTSEYDYKSKHGSYINEFYQLFVEPKSERVSLEQHMANSDLLVNHLQSFTNDRITLILQLIDHNRNIFAKINAAIRIERFDKETSAHERQGVVASEEHMSNLMLAALPQNQPLEIANKILKLADARPLKKEIDEPQISSGQLENLPSSPIRQTRETRETRKDIAFAILTLMTLYGLSKFQAWQRVKKYFTDKVHSQNHKQIHNTRKRHLSQKKSKRQQHQLKLVSK